MISNFCEHFMKLWRTKSTNSVTSESNLIRCLGLFNLVVIGIGAMIGSGIYVMSGFAIRDQAGPSTVLSFLVAAFIVLLIAACYTELATKLHKTGSTYLYIYLTIGEFPAFVTGLSTMIMICLGGAVNSRAWSFYLDSLCNDAISNFTMEHVAEWNIGPPIARYPDFLAVVLLAFLTLVVALGADFSAKFSTLFVFINVSVLILVTVCGFVFGDLRNWTGDGVGGFFPYGWSGTIQATAVCFWAFSGFELISCAVEETRDPKRNIPLATSIIMLIVTCLYISTTAALSLMVPYSSLSSTTPLATVFVDIGQNWGRYVVSVGILCAFTTSILSTFYSFARIGLAMAEDGLIFMWFGRINERTKVPILSTIFCGILESLIAFCLDIENLISFSVNLILLSYCAVCASVIIISYRPPKDVDTESQPMRAMNDECVPVKPVVENYTPLTSSDAGSVQLETAVTVVGHKSDRADDVLSVEEIAGSFQDTAICESPIQGVGPLECNLNKSANLTEEQSNETLTNSSSPDISSSEVVHPFAVENHDVGLSETGFLLKAFHCLKPCMICKNGKCALFALGMMSLFMLGLSFCIKYAIQPLEHGLWWSVVLFGLAVIGIIVFFVIICVHKQTYRQVVLKLHCVPLVPTIAMVTCLVLLVSNSTRSSWIGCGALLAFASLIYISYSVRHSKLNRDIHALEFKYHRLSEADDSD